MLLHDTAPSSWQRRTPVRLRVLPQQKWGSSVLRANVTFTTMWRVTSWANVGTCRKVGILVRLLATTLYEAKTPF